MIMTKEQKKQVENLVDNLGEVNDKPKRLFRALADFADAFIEDEKKKDRIFYGIEQLEEKHNKGHKLPDLLTDLRVVKKETEKELLIHSDEREYILGVQNTANKMTKKILDLDYI